MNATLNRECLKYEKGERILLGLPVFTVGNAAINCSSDCTQKAVLFPVILSAMNIFEFALTVNVSNGFFLLSFWVF